jgi:uncharacterized protein (TIGR03437 family)
MRFTASLLLGIFCGGGLAGANLVFQNNFGATQVTSAAAIALDSQGNVYVAGSQSPPNSGFGTAFVSKWSPDGSQLLYTTSFGGSGLTNATAIAVDSEGSAYVAGYTSSPDFPVSSNAVQKTLAAPFDAFVAKFSLDGSQMVYSTLLGGAGSEQAYAQAFGIAVDSGGNVLVTGATQGTNFQVTPNAFQSAPGPGCSQSTIYLGLATAGDAFVTKIAPDGASLVYSTLLGGSCATLGQAIALDASGNAWVTGKTESRDFPVTVGALQTQFGGGGFDGYVAQFTAAGSLTYASYLGGGGYDTATGIALDSAGNLYVAGVSNGLPQSASSGGFQPHPGPPCSILNGGPPELIPAGAPFVMKLAPDASSVSDLTYLGGGCLASASVAVDSSGAPWVAGSSLIGPNPSIPTVSPIQVGGPGFLGKFSSDFTQLLFSTYFQAVNGLRLDSSGLGYIAGADRLTTTQLGFVAKVDPTPPQISLDQVLTTGSVVFESNAGIGVAPGEVLRLIGKGIGPTAVTPGIVNSAGFVTSSVAGVEVTFGGVPAPLLSVSAGEIDCVAPFEILSQAGSTSIQSTTSIQVQYNGARSNPVSMPVVATAVEVLAVLNPYFTANSSSSPVNMGSTMSLYLAGVGQTNPPSQDGQVNQSPLAQSGIPIQLQYSEPDIDNGVTQNLQITYSGAAPGLIAGILQLNFAAPPYRSMPTTVTVLVPGSFTSFPVWTYFINPSPGP